MIDPGEEMIAEDLRRLGVRNHPVLAFLRRRHPVNRWLGRLRMRVGTGQAAVEPFQV
jgi:hypothetical protein